MSETPKVRCPKCGAWVPAYYLVCPYCGANLTERPVLVSEVRGFYERTRALVKSLSSLNFRRVRELLFVPVRPASFISLMIIALGLSRPFIAYPYGYLTVIVFRLLRLVLLRFIVGIYVTIIGVKKIENRDVQTEILELGGLRLLLLSRISFFVRSVAFILGLIAFVYSAAALYRYRQFGKLRDYFIIPTIALLVFLGFLALRFLLSDRCSSWKTSRRSFVNTPY